MQWMLAAGFLPGCFPVTCAQVVGADSDRDPATGIPVVTVRCGDTQIARSTCYDGGSKRRTATGWDILCDGALLTSVDLSNPPTRGAE